MGVALTRSRLRLNYIVLKWSILNLLSAISAELTFEKDENATLVPYPLLSQKIITVLPVAENATAERDFREGASAKNGTLKVKRLSQKRLDEDIRTRGSEAKGFKIPTKNLKVIRPNGTLPTLQRLTSEGLGSMMSRKGQRKKHRQKGSVVRVIDATKELSLSGSRENEESESRSYSYDPNYPVYNYQAAPSESEEEAVSNFGMVKDVWSSYPDHDPQSPTFPPLTTTFAPKILPNPVPVHGDYPFTDWRPPFLNPPRIRRPPGVEEPPIYVDYVDDTRVINLDGLGRYWQAQGQNGPVLIRTGYHRFQDEDTIEYQQYKDHEEHHGWDLSKIAMYLLMKLGLFKLKMFVLLKLALLFLLKMKILLMALFLKLLALMKAAKLLKLLFWPLLLAFLAPLIGLLLAPILATLPMLINALLNMIQVPVFVPNEDMPSMETRTPEEGEASESRAPVSLATLAHFKMILSSEKCLKRVICELAAKRKPSVRSVIISKLLDLIVAMAPYQTLKTYVKVYKSGLYVHQNQTEPWCSSQYECSQMKDKDTKSKNGTINS